MEAGTIENQAMEAQELSSYSVIAYPGNELPGQYINLIRSRWMRSLRYGNDYFKLIDSKAYYEVYEKYIVSILARPDCVIKLAVLTDDTDVVLGFAVIEGTTLHYCNTHKDQRKIGIATSLVPKNIDCITHLTNIGMSIWTAKLPNAKFNPFK